MEKCYLNSIEYLEAEFKELGLEGFCKRYAKRDIFLGQADSVNFVISKLEEYAKQDVKKVYII